MIKLLYENRIVFLEYVRFRCGLKIKVCICLLNIYGVRNMVDLGLKRHLL